ncbi:MAG TPA: transporter, partial [Gemmatimonadaceae bacterium]|nr:transporter [Gemmatimonadaceae bacterium]
MPFTTLRLLTTLVLLLGGMSVRGLVAQQPLETETARLPRRGGLLVSGTYEFQASPQGTEHAVPVALEYGIANRLALLVEPVLVTMIRPEAPPNATGVGDLEVTLQYLARGEGRLMPALALAAEEKLPTATNRQIGTGRADFTPYLIASKHIGRNEVHANVGYSFMGKPAGLSVQNTINLALAIERQMTPRLGVVAEVLSTSAAAGADGGESSVNAPEIAGAEQVAMVGMRYRRGPNIWYSIGVTYDNT